MAKKQDPELEKALQIPFFESIIKDFGEEIYRNTPCFYCKDLVFDADFPKLKHLCKPLYEKFQDLHGDEVFEDHYKKYNEYLEQRKNFRRYKRS